MVDFQLNVYHEAANEAGLNAFLVYMKDNYPTVIQGAAAHSKNLKCSALFVFTVYTEMVAAVQDIKANFDIEYNLQVNV